MFHYKVKWIRQALGQIHCFLIVVNELVKVTTFRYGPAHTGLHKDEDKMERYSYPKSFYKAPKVPDYSSLGERKRLSCPSLRQFFKIMKRWMVGTKDSRILLGGISSQRFKQLSLTQEGRILSRDQLLRVTTIIAIDDSLRNLLPRGQANQWVQTSSRDWNFCGRTPLNAMVDGGILTLWELRWQLQDRASVSNETEREQ
jgi:hypothetical protein